MESALLAKGKVHTYVVSYSMNMGMGGLDLMVCGKLEK